MNTKEAYKEFFGVEHDPDSTTTNKSVLKFAEAYATEYRGLGPKKRINLKSAIDSLPDIHITRVTKIVRALTTENSEIIKARLKPLLKEYFKIS